MNKKTKAFWWAVVAVVGTVAYVHMAQWTVRPASYLAAGVVVGSWLALLHHAPVLFRWIGELLQPCSVAVRDEAGRLLLLAGKALMTVSVRLFDAGARMQARS